MVSFITYLGSDILLLQCSVVPNPDKMLGAGTPGGHEYRDAGLLRAVWEAGCRDGNALYEANKVE